jgi:NADH pyrophosphatase NudC (nudix superfamily)
MEREKFSDAWIESQLRFMLKPPSFCGECGAKLDVVDNLDAKLCRQCEEVE